jgi:Raf kinase inhibitor-like YbhB/YbcL family protein
MRTAYFFLGLGFLILFAFFSLTANVDKKPSSKNTMLALTAPAFQHNSLIPAVYTCDGEGKNPALSIAGVPAGAKSLVLIVDDPDIPQSVKDALGVELIDHWVIFNIPPETLQIPEAAAPPGLEGKNTRGNSAYMGPCPPDREHRYFFKLYALDALLDLSAGASRADIEKAMEGHILESAELIGRYDRPR